MVDVRLSYDVPSQSGGVLVMMRIWRCIQWLSMHGARAFCVYSVGAEQVKGAEASDAADHRTSRARVDGEGAEAEGRLHGDEQVPERGTELCR